MMKNFPKINCNENNNLLIAIIIIGVFIIQNVEGKKENLDKNKSSELIEITGKPFKQKHKEIKNSLPNLKPQLGNQSLHEGINATAHQKIEKVVSTELDHNHKKTVQLFIERLTKIKNLCMEKRRKDKTKKDGNHVVAKFSEWRRWQEQFPGCNPLINKYQSPINIDTRKVIRSNQTQTLIVYSDSPTQNKYTLKYEHQSDSNIDVTVDALNIGISGNVYRETTYISGLGDSAYRMFHSAFFLFTTVNVSSERSLHQINGHKFPLEIVLLFQDFNKFLVTQIHVMVKITIKDNPVFFPIVQAVSKLKDRIDKYNRKDEAITKIEKRVLELSYLTETLEDEEACVTDDQGYAKKIKQLIALQNNFIQYEEILSRSPHRIKEINEDVRKLRSAKLNIEIQRKSLQKERDESEQNYKQKIEQGFLRRGDRDDVDFHKSLKLMEELEDVKPAANKIAGQIQNLNIEIEEENDLIEDAKESLDLLKIGECEGCSFQTSRDIQQLITKMNKSLHFFRLKKSELKTEFKEIDESYQLWVHIADSFQASWLLPSIGGHYAYNGSCPLPPCSKRKFVIVMEKSISISQAQFDILTSIPRPNNKDRILNKPSVEYETMAETIPPLHEVGDRRIWYNHKNLQFKFDDGYHMPSSLRRIQKQERKERLKSPVGRIECSFMKYLMISLFHVGIKLFSSPI